MLVLVFVCRCTSCQRGRCAPLPAAAALSRGPWWAACSRVPASAGVWVGWSGGWVGCREQVMCGRVRCGAQMQPSRCLTPSKCKWPAVRPGRLLVGPPCAPLCRRCQSVIWESHALAAGDKAPLQGGVLQLAERTLAGLRAGGSELAYKALDAACQLLVVSCVYYLKCYLTVPNMHCTTCAQLP